MNDAMASWETERDMSDGFGNFSKVMVVRRGYKLERNSQNLLADGKY